MNTQIINKAKSMTKIERCNDFITYNTIFTYNLAPIYSLQKRRPRNDEMVALVMAEADAFVLSPGPHSRWWTDK